MSSNPLADPPPSLLPFSNRYQAAWQEHATRVVQRQHVLQTYLVFIGGVFAVYYASKSPKTALTGAMVSAVTPFNFLDLDLFLWGGIAVLTVACCALLWTHNSVMLRLQRFMMYCEKIAFTQCQTYPMVYGDVFLFYFYSNTDKGIARFHFFHRIITRIIYSLIFFCANAFAGYIVGRGQTNLLALACVYGALFFICGFFLFDGVFSEEENLSDPMLFHCRSPQ